MTEQNPAIFIQAGTHPAEDVRRAFDLFLGTGSEGIVAAADLAVTETGTPAMSVTVATGRAIIQGTEGTYQGPYIVENRGITVATVTDSDVSNPRIDLVVARVQDQAYSGTTNAWSLAVIAGTPAASPVAPTLPANALLLATVTVAAAVSTIVNANIVDGRVVHPAAYYAGDTVPVGDGGTGATTAGAARTALGAADATTVFNLGNDVSSNWGRLNGIDTVQATQNTDIGTNTTKLAGIEAGADVTDSANVEAAVTGGGTDSVVIGPSAASAGDNSVAVGKQAQAAGSYSTAAGWAASSAGSNSCAYGRLASAAGNVGSAFGHQASAGGGYSLAAAWGASAGGDYSVALGEGATVSAVARGVAVGPDTSVTGVNAVAAGYAATATATGAGSFGALSDATATNAYAIGYNITAAIANTVSVNNLEVQGDITVLGGGLPAEIMTAASDEETAITTGTGVMQFRMPYAMTGTSIRASLGSACSSGTFILDLNVNGATVLSTKVTIDATEKTSVTAVTPAVLSVTAWPDDAIVTIDVDGQANGTGTGLKVTMIGTRA